MKTKIDIEKLCRWSVREELPKGKPVSTSAWDAITSFGQLGARIDTGGGGVDAFGFVPGAPHQDAVIVGDEIAQISTSWRFKISADVFEVFGDEAAIAGDAVPMLAKAIFNPRSIVLSNLMMGKRPAWQFETPTPYQMKSVFRDAMQALRERPLVWGIDQDGRLVELLPRRGRAAQQRGVYDLDCMPRSPLRWDDPGLLAIGDSRAEYLAYFDALTSLRKNLAGRLSEFEPMLPNITRRPWVTGQTPTSRVLEDGAPAGSITDRLPLAPKRHAAGPPIASDIEMKMKQSRATARIKKASGPGYARQSAIT